MDASHVYLAPGMFGFSRVGSYVYFTHVEEALKRRFADAGREVRIHFVDVHPTASIRRRAATAVRLIEETATGNGPIHLYGHSTGGLDARLVASPTMRVAGHQHPMATERHQRIRSVTSVNTPHFGTPLASFFATVSGQRLLAAVSTLGIAALTVGAPPLALTSSLVAAFGRIDQAVGLQLRLIDTAVDGIVRLLDDASSKELRTFVQKLRTDQGAVIQLMPEAMDLFQAGVEDAAHVTYQCTASHAPAPGLGHWVKAARSPWANITAPAFATLFRLTALENAIYPCAPDDGSAERALTERLGMAPPTIASDGVVPIRSQVWGKLVWAGLGDHLDVVGHFASAKGDDPVHVDWLSSGSGFSSKDFAELMDAIAKGMLAAE